MNDFPMDHFSWTQLQMFFKCGEQYRLRYVEKKIIPPGIVLIRGGSVHKGRKANLGQKVKSGVDLPLEDVEDVIAEAVRAAFVGDVRLVGEESTVGLKNLRGETIDTSVRLGVLDYEEIQREITPVLVEEKVVVKHDDLPIPIHLYIDTAQRGPNDPGPIVRDLKTKLRSPNKDEADKSDQLTMYSWGWRALVQGGDERAKEFEHMLTLDCMVATKEPKSVVQTTRRTARDHELLMRRVKVALDSIKAGAFPPCNRDMWLCDPKWCGYHGNGCQYV